MALLEGNFSMANKVFILKELNKKLMLDEFQVGVIGSDGYCYTLRAGVAAFWEKNKLHYTSVNRYIAIKCGICGTYFLGNFSGLYCSKECKHKARLKNTKNFRKRKIAKKIAMHPSCIVCGKNLTAKRSTRKCCSSRCRQALYRKQKSHSESMPD